MFPSSRFSFEQPADSAAQKLLEAAHSLQMTFNRGGKHFGPFVTFELSGGFDSKVANNHAIALELLRAFQSLLNLPCEGGADDDDDTDELC